MTPSTSSLHAAKLVSGVVRPEDPAFDRLRRTRTFRRGRFARWCRARVGVVGGGLLGSRIVRELVRSGAYVYVWDHGLGAIENLGTQCVAPGIFKVDAVIGDCDAILPGRAQGFATKIQHASITDLDRLSVILDCSDDPGLALLLTRISNGLGRPLLRCAVDGTGDRELGRVLCSDARRGRACQVCSYTSRDLFGSHPNTPCPGAGPDRLRPTLAGAPIAMAVAGLALLQAQRLVTGNDRHLVFNREVIIDLDGPQMVSYEHRRSAACLSGHVRWRLTRLGLQARIATLADVFAAARQRFGRTQFFVEPFAHPLSLRASCECGTAHDTVGSLFATPPTCSRCGQPMMWLREAVLDQITENQASALGILDVPADTLGFPDRGAMFVVRAPGERPLYLVLD